MFNNNYKIIVKEFLKKDFAHTPEDGEKIVANIFAKNNSNKNVDIDFSGIKTVNTAFCNVVYEGLKKEKRDWNVKLVNCNALVLETFNRVKENFDYKEMKNDL